MFKNVTIGADPEVFFHNVDKTKGFLSAEGLVGGTKEQPKKILQEEGEGFAVQEDNVMAEYCIPPCKTQEDFIENNLKVLDYLSDVAELNKAVVVITPSAEFDYNSVNTEQAKTFGCEPDFGVYIEDLNPIIDANQIEGNFRFAGGHIHVGYDNPDFNQTVKLVKAMDIFLSLPSVWLDKDSKRKQYYGTAGRFRIKDYGLEYRTLSNFWLQSKEGIAWVYEQTMKAVEYVNSGDFDKIPENVLSDVQKYIDQNSFLMAKTLHSRLTKETTKLSFK